MKLLRPLVEAAGADYRQWLTLTRVMLAADLRSPSSMNLSQGADSQTQKKMLRAQAIMYGVMGFFLAPIVWFVPDAFLSATILFTIILFMVGTMMLIEFQSVVISPDDYTVLAFQPVSSRTYFLVKLTNVLIYVGALASLLGAASVVTFFVRHGWVVGIASALGLYGMAVFTALAMIGLYATILRYAHPNRLRRVLSYLQLAMSFAFYAGIIFGGQLFDEERLAGLAFELTPLTVLHPATWFASIPGLATGGIATLPGAAAVVAGVVALVGLFWFTTNHLSLSYAERLGAMSSASETKPLPEGKGEDNAYALYRAKLSSAGPLTRLLRSIASAEMRAVSTLIRAQFRYDMKFRMGVLGILPLTLMYLWMSVEDGILPDPFVESSFAAAGDLGLLHLAVIFMPVMLMVSVTHSDSFQAAWIFFTTPSDEAKLVLHTKNLVVLYFTIPYLVLVGAIFAYFFDALWHAAVHVFLLGLFSNFALQVAVLRNPQLPFSSAVQKGQRTGGMFFIIAAAAVAVMLVLPVLLSVAYSTLAALLITLAVLLLASVAMERAAARRVRARVAGLEFPG